jgi:hypothetical protein
MWILLANELVVREGMGHLAALEASPDVRPRRSALAA